MHGNGPATTCSLQWPKHRTSPSGPSRATPMGAQWMRHAGLQPPRAIDSGKLFPTYAAAIGHGSPTRSPTR
eukprot:3916994-Lingulodinium_polyedra.AAC.1